MAYNPDFDMNFTGIPKQNVGATSQPKQTVPTQSKEDRARELGRGTRIVLDKGQMVLRKAGVAVLGVVAGVSLVGSITGVIDLVGVATHPNVFGVADWISYGVGTAVSLFIARKSVPLFMKNCKLTKGIYDSIKAVGDSFKDGIGSFKESFDEGYNEGHTRGRK